MIVNKFHNENIEESRVDIYYKDIDAEITGLLNYLSEDKKIIGKSDKVQVILSPRDIFYFEIVDRKCFAYLSACVYNVDFNLRDILERFGSMGYVRISKSMVLNVYRIKEIKSDIQMRMIVVLENDESVVVNRKYKKEFYNYMKHLLEGGLGNENI